MREAADTLQSSGAPKSIPHLLLALSDSDVVKTILGQFKIKVDDLKRQIESEAKRGDKPFEGRDRRVAPGQDALSRAFVASNELGHSYSRAGAFPDRARRGRRRFGGQPAAPLRPHAASAAPAGKQGGRQGAEDGRAETPTNTPELDKYSRDLTKMAREGKLDPVIGRAQRSTTSKCKKNNPVLIGEPASARPPSSKGWRSAWSPAKCPRRCATSVWSNSTSTPWWQAPSTAASSRSACRRCSRK